jgi:transcriptional regulator with XRE-family HTH domain
MEHMNIYSAIGKRVREERSKAGLTLEELAEAASISSSFLAYVERGKKKASLETIKKLADGLHVPIANLFSAIQPGRVKDEMKIIRSLVPLLKEKNTNDRELIMDILKTVSKKLAKKR